MKRNLFLVGAAMLALSGVLSVAAPQGTVFTYQGKLTSGGVAANGNYDMWFKLYTDPSAGTQVGATVTTNAVPVTNGLFTVSLDFGAFTGQACWLDIWVHNSTNDPAVDWVWLSPPQQVTPAPCATYSANAGVAVTASNVVAGGISAPSIAAAQVVKSLNGLHDDLTLAAGSGVTITPSGSTLQISATGVSGGGWSLSGNTVAPGQFLGSINSQPLEFWVNGTRALRIEPSGLSPSVPAPNLVGGCWSNSVSSGAAGATVAGGGYDSMPNQAGNFGFVGGGYANTTGEEAVVGGGGDNSASGTDAVVGGGAGNNAYATAATVAGGVQNQAGSDWASVGGGTNNVASGRGATVPGGNGNEAAGVNSFAAGTFASAIHDGAFVWGDATYTPVTSTAANQFLVQASGGMQFQSSTAPMLAVDSTGNLAANGWVGSMGGQLQLTASAIRVEAGSSGWTNVPVQRFQLRSNYRTGDTPNLIGGSFLNWIAPTAYSSIIAGGGGEAGWGLSSLSNLVTGSWSTISGGGANEIDSYFSTIGGGMQNVINAGQSVLNVAQNPRVATIAGGQLNAIGLSGFGEAIGGGFGNQIGRTNDCTTIAGGRSNAVGNNVDSANIGGGFGNIISDGSYNSTIGGGFSNAVQTTSLNSTIAGGENNTINSNGGRSTIGGGGYNTIGQGLNDSTIAGGSINTVQAGASYSTIGGGNNNWIAGQGATIPGGEYNEADGSDSFAAGYKAKAGHNGMFVWADSKNFDFRPESYGFYDNTFDVRATGGSLWITAVDSSGNGTTGPYFVPGDLGWRSSCDRNLKENFQPVDTQALLEKLCQMPITQWNVKAQSPDIRHVGPVAQDFHAAFSLGGTDDKSISSIDEAGVAFAAIQALNQKLDQTVKAKDAEIQALRQVVAELQETVGRLAPPAK